MSVHECPWPSDFRSLIDKCVESTHVSKPVSTNTVHTEGVDGGNTKTKKNGSFANYSLVFRFASLCRQQKMLSTLKLNTKGIITRFLGNCPPTPPLSQH